MLLGLASRRYGEWLPSFLAAYVGDTLWALLVFWLVGFGWPSSISKQRATGAISFAFLIELSQLIHPKWLETLRATTLGGLVLGHGFLWTDLVCYSVGVSAGYLVESMLRQQYRPRPV
jgi:hypothetical protein